jgi:hypothetical protein
MVVFFLIPSPFLFLRALRLGPPRSGEASCEASWKE